MTETAGRCVAVVAAAALFAACSQSMPSEPDPAAGADSALGAGVAFVAHLSGSEEVPPNDSSATGQAVIRVNRSGDSLHYRLIASNIQNVVAAHIHLGAAGENGPPVVFLFGPADPGGGPSNGVLSSGTIEASDLIGPLAGEPLSALLDAMAAGNTYVNVHTNDGVDPTDTGPGDIPGGEIRGQIR